MRSGIVYDMRLENDPVTIGELARLSNPAHAAPVDLDGDGLRDLLMADLGSFQPGDHDRGAVVWLRGRKERTYTYRASSERRPPISTGTAIWILSRARWRHRGRKPPVICLWWCGWSRQCRAGSCGTCWRSARPHMPHWMSVTSIATATATPTSSSATSARYAGRQSALTLREPPRAEVTRRSLPQPPNAGLLLLPAHRDCGISPQRLAVADSSQGAVDPPLSFARRWPVSVSRRDRKSVV